jgi:uncharacterized protein YndB with AHSA1/START domain
VAIERGCLVLADISGYTKYLAGVELDHSQDILADLLGVVVGHLKSRLVLAKLEGDAVFCYDRGGEDSDGLALLIMMEGCYFAFQERQRDIKHATTCECNACRLIPQLSLKFVGHHGAYVIHEVVGNRELVGPDVIVAHRLLKNSVTERTGLRGYALLSKAFLDRFGLDSGALALTEQSEAYEDVGEIRGFVHDLERRWAEEQERRSVIVTPEESVGGLVVELPVPPAVAWDYVTMPEKRMQWQAATTRLDQENPNGIPGVGTTNHCVHGDMSIDEFILDWKPFRYLTYRSLGPMFGFLMTYVFEPLEGGRRTRMTARIKPEGTEEEKAALAAAAPELSRSFEAGLRDLSEMLSGAQPTLTSSL